MITEVIMPKLGQTMEEGLLVEWFKQEGDGVERGDLLYTLESDKATLDVEATFRGYLRTILVEEGESVPVLTVVALITKTPDEDIEGYQPAAPVEPVEADEQVETGEGTTVTTAAAGTVAASPRARRVAREKGVDLSRVTGTGEGGRIVEKDIEAFLAAGEEPAAAASPPEVSPTEIPQVEVKDTVPLTGLRGIIAERMASSAHSTARVTLVSEVDATALVEFREHLKKEVSGQWGFIPGYTELLSAAVTRALKEFPWMNARLSADGMTIEHLKNINLGIAVDTDRGLLVLVVRNAGEKSLRTFGTELAGMVERALAGRSLPDDLTGGTFTITNLGAFGIDAFTPVINPPEAAVLGVGRIQSKPVVEGDEIVIRQMLTLSLVFDHRLMDGAPAARFLERVTDLIREPEELLERGDG